MKHYFYVFITLCKPAIIFKMISLTFSHNNSAYFSCLKLHIMSHKIFNCCKIFFICFVFTSCGNKKEDEKLFEELNACLENSNKVIDATSRNFLFAMHEKTKDVRTHDKAILWQPKTDSIDKSSAELINYIDSLRNKVSSKLSEQDLKKLYKKLINYKQQMQLLDSFMYKDLSKDMKITTEVKNAEEQTDTEFCKSFNTSTQLLNLAICKNRIIKIKAALLEYCDVQTSYTICGFDILMPIILQNSTHFKPKEEIKITAGVGSFLSRPQPKIFINDKVIELNFNAVGEFKQTVPSKPGKYHKTVKIQFTKPDGTIGIAEKEITYTVDE